MQSVGRAGLEDIVPVLNVFGTVVSEGQGTRAFRYNRGITFPVSVRMGDRDNLGAFRHRLAGLHNQFRLPRVEAAGDGSVAGVFAAVNFLIREAIDRAFTDDQAPVGRI